MSHSDTTQKRNRPTKRVALIVGFVFLLALPVAVVHRRARVRRTTKPTARAVVLPRRHVDGVATTLAATNTPLFAVMIDWSPDALPATGVASSSLVIEVPVEGPINRLVAFFPSDSLVPQIGPIRSARPYFADFVKEFNAVYVHVGGSPSGLERIEQLNLRDLNEFYFGKYFLRDGARERPHNVYATLEMLRTAAADRKFDVLPDYEPWQWKQDGKVAATTAVRPEGWEFDAPRDAYRLRYGNEVYHDSGGTEVFAKNVVVLHTDIGVIDDLLRKRIRTLGEGSAEVYQDGRRIAGVWKKKTPESRLRFFGSDGKEIQFNAGLTWITIGPTR